MSDEITKLREQIASMSAAHAKEVEGLKGHLATARQARTEMGDQLSVAQRMAEERRVALEAATAQSAGLQAQIEQFGAKQAEFTDLQGKHAALQSQFDRFKALPRALRDDSAFTIASALYPEGAEGAPEFGEWVQAQVAEKAPWTVGFTAQASPAPAAPEAPPAEAPQAPPPSFNKSNRGTPPPATSYSAKDVQTMSDEEFRANVDALYSAGVH